MQYVIALALSLTLGSVCLAQAQTSAPDSPSAPETENGRFALSPIADGVLRLDTRTGAVSTCKNDGQGWACMAAPDERAAYDLEIGRLQAENDGLRAELARRGDTTQGKTDEALPKSDSLGPNGPRRADAERKIEIPLPSERDVNRVMGFLENAWRRLVEMASRMQRGADDKI